MSMKDTKRRRVGTLVALVALALGMVSAASPRVALAAGGGLQGTPFGTSPWWSQDAGYSAAYDGNTNSFFDYFYPDGGYAGIDLGDGSAKAVAAIRYYPRDGAGSRMVGGKFQGSNTASDSGYTDLFTISAAPNGWASATVSDPTAYRYLRYLAPNGGYGNVAEVEFYDAAGAATLLPTQWQQTDVGNTGVGGNVAYNGGTFAVAGGGDGIGGGYDQFHYVYQNLSGNGQIIARVAGIQNGKPGTEAGLIIRETVDGWPPAREALVRVNGTGELAFEARTDPQGNGATTGGATVTTPYWLKLVRQNSTFSGFASPDGLTWTQLGSATIGMGANVTIGLAGGGNTYGTLATSTFDSVQVASGVQPPWADNDIGNTGAAGDATSSGGIFTINGAGDEIGGGYDQFHYVYQSISGDGQIVARVASIQSANANTKAALVIRETLDGWPPAREAIVGVTKANGAFFAARAAPQTNAIQTSGPAINVPYWLKLVRNGSMFTGYGSTDGTTWTQIGSATLAIGANAYVGLAGGGQTFGQLATSVFDNVSFVPSVAATVNWDNSRSVINRGAYGLNAFNAYNPPEIDAAYNANIAYMNPGALRYHSFEMMGDSKTTRNGWIDTANRRWDGEKIHAALANMTGLDRNAAVQIDIPIWPSWMDANSDAFLDADQYDAYAAWCAELVRIVNVQYGHHVTFWEPTNERDDVYYVRFKNAGQPDKLDDLIDIYNRAARAMKAVDPSIKVGGLAFARPDLYDQVRRFVSATVAAGTLDYLSMHGYASGDQSEPDSQIYNRAYNAADPTINSLAKHGADVRAILDAASPTVHIPIWFDEYNISWTYQNNDPRMQNNKGAVFDALTRVYLHDAGVDITNAWNEKDGVYGKTDGSNALRPSAHLFHLLNSYALGQRVATTSSNDRAIVTYAVRDEERGIRTYMIVNRSASAQKVITTFGGWKPKFDSFNRYQISAAGFTSDTIGWATLKTDGIIVPDNSVTLLVVGEKPVKPVLECVARTASGYTAYFGYKNENSLPMTLAVGANNRFTPGPDNRGQTTVFQPGRQQRTFSVNFDGSNLVWTLNGRTATASSSSAACQ